MRAVASERSCLHCGIGEAEVKAVRARDGYTLGCGIESNTEAGFDYEELSPMHRWAPWKDGELKRLGIKPESYEKYRTDTSGGLMYAACDDRLQGHRIAAKDIHWGDYLMHPAGECIECGYRDSALAGKEKNDE